MEQESPARKQLARDAKREALRRLEDAARTMEEYRNVLVQWRERDKLRRRRWNRWEVGRPNAEMLHWDRVKAGDEDGRIKEELETVIPAPFGGYEWWRQLLRGDFLDVIHDCPYEMHELTTSRPIFDLLQTLNENQLEVMYYWVIRQEKPKQIAARRGQSTRNILKVYTGLMRGLWKKLHDRLAPRFDAGLPLTFAQKQFVEDYRADRLKIRMPKSKKGKKKAALDEQNGN
ncbi:hypothetical protein LJC07_00565 [Christensenellaceae bacterium OttesenSCG-928-L17]|nr:hypothetical protein [Christensenellaceae bacterium OttesenSCG-928-L17]